jgi:hypothetical protein
LVNRPAIEIRIARARPFWAECHPGGEGAAFCYRQGVFSGLPPSVGGRRQYDKPFVVVMAVEEYERLKVSEIGRVDSRPSTSAKEE